MQFSEQLTSSVQEELATYGIVLTPEEMSHTLEIAADQFDGATKTPNSNKQTIMVRAGMNAFETLFKAEEESNTPT